MSTHESNPPSRKSKGDLERARSAIALQSEIVDMLSALPDAPTADETASRSLETADEVHPEIQQMLAALPDAAPAAAPAPRSAAGRGKAQDDFELQAGVELRPAVRPSPPAAGGRSAPPPASGQKLPRYASEAAAKGKQKRSAKRVAEELPDLIGEVDENFIDGVLRGPVPLAPPPRKPSIAEVTTFPENPRSNPFGGAPAPAGDAVQPDSNTAFDHGGLAQRVLDELEKYSIPSVSRLRIAVHGGSVTIMGDVPTDYEKKLVMHFCQKVEGVTEVVDMMRVAGGQGLAPDPALAVAAPVRRPPRRAFSRPGLQLNFPFRAKHVGAAAALVLMIWAGYSYATRDPSKLSVYPVTGKVLLDGTAPEGAAVVLHPLDDSLTIRPRGVVGADGTFRLTTYLPSDGAPIGEYKLTVQWNKSVDVDGEPVPGPNLLPAELARPESTTFKVAVQSGKNELAPLEIRK